MYNLKVVFTPCLTWILEILHENVPRAVLSLEQGLTILSNSKPKRWNDP